MGLELETYYTGKGGDGEIPNRHRECPLILSHECKIFAHCYSLLFSVYSEGYSFPAVLFCIIIPCLLAARSELISA